MNLPPEALFHPEKASDKLSVSAKEVINFYFKVHNTRTHGYESYEKNWFFSFRE